MENISEISTLSNASHAVPGTGKLATDQMAHSRGVNDLNKDEINWKNRCLELEKQLLDFDARTGRLRELLHEKLQEQEVRVQEATRRAEIAEKELKRVQSAGMIPNNDLKRSSKDTPFVFGPKNNTSSTTTSTTTTITDKDAIIADLKLKIEQYHEQRRQEIKRIEGHSKKIRDWVASKLIQLETKNAALQSERDLLAEKVESLTKKLQKVHHRSDADDINICFAGSEYFHNESPDTDEEAPNNDSSGACHPPKSAPRLMPEVKIERKVFPKDLALSFLSSCDESQATDVNTSRSSDDETQVAVAVAPTAEVAVVEAEVVNFVKVDEESSRRNDLMERFLAMKHDEDNHTVSALATMPRCKAGEFCVPNYGGANRSKKTKATDRNCRSSSVAPQINPQPPMVPLRRVPSWERRIHEVAKVGLKVHPGFPEVSSFHHKRTILFYENGGCASSNVPVFAVTRKRTIKISDSPFSSHSTDKSSRTQKILFDVTTPNSPTSLRFKSHSRQNSGSRPHSATVPSSYATTATQPGFLLSASTRENSCFSDKRYANFQFPQCAADAKTDKRKMAEVATRDDPSSNAESRIQTSSSSSPLQQQQQQQNHHHHQPITNHQTNQNVESVLSDHGSCPEHMTQSDTSSDYALPPDDSDLGFGCCPDQKETCFVCVGSQGNCEAKGGDDDDDDAGDKWGIFEEEVIKAGFLVHLQHNVRGWQGSWCIFTGRDLRIYPVTGDQPPSLVALDGGTKLAQSDNTFVVSTRNMRNTFACNSASSSTSWVQVLSESISWLSGDGDHVTSSTVGWNHSAAYCFFKSRNGQIEKCWCTLSDNVMNFYKTPKSQMPYLKLSLNEFRIEELNSIKSNPNSPKFTSLLAMWPSSSSSTSSSSSSSSSDPSPIYLHIPDEPQAKDWFQRILKSSTSNVLNASKQGSDYDQCVFKLLSADGVPTSSLWKEPILSFSKVPLTKPLISLPSGDLSKRATDMFKHILDFMSLPIDWSDLDIKLNLVQRIFSLCHHHHHLHNELFCQLMKQTTRSHQQQKSLGNFLCGGHHWFLCDTSPTSPLNSTIETTDPKSPTGSSSHPISIQAWQLLTIALHLFLPNRQSILWMLNKHLQRNADSRSECGKYAVYCQSAMERVQLNGPRSHPPSQLEVLSVLSHNPYHHSQPISIPVHLPNSSYQVVSFDGSTLVSEFLLNLNKSMEMRDSCSSGFALFACDSNNPQREVCCLDSNAKVCDILSCLQVLLLKLSSKKSSTSPTIKLLYRNRLYFKSLCRFETEKERLLLAFQFHSELMEGRFPVTEELALELAALMAQIEYGDMRPTSDLKSSSTSSQSSHSPHHQHILISQIIDRFFPKFVINSAENQRMESRLVNSWSLLKGKSTEDCVKVFLAAVREWPWCGTRMLLVKLKVETTTSDDVWFCVHEDGISILDLKSLKPIYSFDYNVIKTFGGYDDDHMFIVIKRSIRSPLAYKRFLFQMSKPEAQEIVLLMADYIKSRSIHKTPQKQPTTAPEDQNDSSAAAR